MKKNKYTEIRKSIDSLTALLICVEKEREWLKSTLDIRVLENNQKLHIANERELAEIATAYQTSIIVTPFSPVWEQQYTQELSIEVNGIRLFTLA